MMIRTMTTIATLFLTLAAGAQDQYVQTGTGSTFDDAIVTAGKKQMAIGKSVKTAKPVVMMGRNVGNKITLDKRNKATLHAVTYADTSALANDVHQVYVNPAEIRPLASNVTPLELKSNSLLVSKAVSGTAKPMKAPAQMNSEYIGKGYIFDQSTKSFSKESEWTMKLSTHTATDGSAKDVLINVIPDEVGLTGTKGFEDGVAVAFTASGNTITVPPTYITTTADYDVYLVNYYSLRNGGDGSLTLQLDEEGNIEMSEQNMMYCATTQTVSPETRKLTASDVLGAFEQVVVESYTIPGHEPSSNIIKEQTWPAYCTDFETSEPQEWVAWKGKYYGQEVMGNLCPDFTNGTADIVCTYEQKGNKIIVKPQAVAKSDDYTFFIFSRRSADHSIELTLGEDGSLNTAYEYGEYLEIGLFTSDTFDPELTTIYGGGSYAGYYKMYTGVFYKEKEINYTFTSEQDYTGVGKDQYDGEQEKWTMSRGKIKDDMVIANILPIPSTLSSSLDAVYVQYTVDGSTINIKPQQIAESDSYYFYCFNPLTEDGSITMTLNADGTIRTEDLSIMYGVFSTKQFDFSHLMGYLSYYTGVEYYAEGEDIPEPVPSAVYEPEGVYLHSGITATGYCYNNNLAMIPACSTLSLRNFTDSSVDSFLWEMERLGSDITTGESESSTLISTERNASFEIGSGIFSPAVLTPKRGDRKGDAYQWGKITATSSGYAYPYVYAGHTATSFAMSDGSVPQITKCNPDFGLAPYEILATPDNNAMGMDISDIICYQGKPSAPLYTTGINLLLSAYSATGTSYLKCQIVKATRRDDGTLTLGSTIASSSAMTVDETGTKNKIYCAHFTDFKDPDGNTLNYMFLEDEFAIVLTGWANGNVSAIPYGESTYNEVGLTSTFFKMKGSNSIQSISNFLPHMAVGFDNAAYGYLVTKDATTVNLSNEGCKARLHIVPMLASQTSSGEYATRLFTQTELPDWLSYSFENEVYGKDEQSFDLVITAAPNTSGSDREQTIRFWQEGAYIDVTVRQTDLAGVEEILSTDQNTPSRCYDITGRLANKSTRGIIISNGKKTIRR